MLFRARKREREQREREAAGESLWSSEFSEKSRTRLLLVFSNISGMHDRIFERAHRIILFDEGAATLTGQANRLEDLLGYINGPESNKTITGIEAILQATAQVAREDPFEPEPRRIWNHLLEGIQDVFERDRLAWRIDDEGLIHPLKSEALHAGILEPTLRLLQVSDSKWKPVEEAFRKALEELAKNDPADSITDAGTALQETLTILGFSGNALGTLIKDARKKGVFGGHDDGLADGIEKILHWVSANRSERGDSHKVVDVSRSDAHMMIHVVGALIVWLVESSS